MKNKGPHDGPVTHDQAKAHLIAEERHDPYRPKGKLPDPTVCPDCGAVYREGRWQWADAAPAGATMARCAACARIAEHAPAGEVVLAGAFVAAHRDEILGLVKNTAAAETREHPLERIIAIAPRGEAIVVETTGMHLARRIGHALESAWNGDLDQHYDAAGHFARMTWRRDA